MTASTLPGKTLFIIFALLTLRASAQILPGPPQQSVDSSWPAMTGTTINVPGGGDLQAALNQAQLGDTITLQAGATYSGTFTLPAKSGSGWIVIRTSAPDSSLPPQGQRIKPSYSASLPKIVAGSGPAIQTAPGAHHYRLVGLEITVASTITMNYGLVLLGDVSTAQNSLSVVPHHLVLDRVYIHGTPNKNLRRGVALNSATTAIVDSFISDCHEVGADSQAISGWNGPGPYKIVNNYLEGAGENLIFGGADPAISNLVPSDIEIRGNYLFKPLRWKVGDPSYAGIAWTVKNLFELKNARRVLIDGNVFEQNWPHSQNGFAILFTVRNQDGTAPWSVVEDITFTNNIVSHSASAVNILGSDDIYQSQESHRILVRNNLFDDIGTAPWGGSGRLFQFLVATHNVTIDHNTGFHTGDVIAVDGTHTELFYRNNLSPNNTYGVGGTGTYGNPALTLSTFFPGAVFVRNILQGGNASSYPPDNFFPATMTAVGFVDFAGGNYRLSTSSPYRNAGTDSKDVGADIDALEAKTAGCVNGTTPGDPPPPPPPPDTTPPAVSITTPSSATTISGMVTIAATATDDIGVAGVQFVIDGLNQGAEDTAAPYSTTWDTSSAANTSHTLTAIARDAAGNRTTSDVVSVIVDNAPPPPPPPPQQTPYTGSPVVVPGQINAEDFDKGGEGVAYHDAIAGNAGGLYRTNEDVDIVSPYPDGYVVNNFETGEWLEYTINVSSGETYRVEALVSSAFTTSRFHVEIDEVDVTGSISVPSTGGWNSFQWVGKDGVNLPAGTHVLRMFANEQYFNLDAIRIVASQTPYSSMPAVPGKWQAENYDRGGEGVAYHDVTAGNQGGQYRTDDVDLIARNSSGSYVVNNFQTGEWLEYTINVTQSGTYSVQAQVSSEFTTSRFHVEIDGVDVTGPVAVPSTGSWQAFQWRGKAGVGVSAGVHVVRISADVEYFNLDAIRIVR